MQLPQLDNYTCDQEGQIHPFYTTDLQVSLVGPVTKARLREAPRRFGSGAAGA